MSKIHSLQYLRGLAAILVVVAHALLHPIAGIDHRFIRIGSLGVALFFVISGFIMVVIAGQGSFSPLVFYRRRIQRVVPLYWLATSAVAAAAFLVPAAFKNTEFGLDQLVCSLFFLPHYRSNGDLAPILKLGWTLNLEMFFYACFGALFFLRSTARVAVLAAVFVGLAALGGLVRFENAFLANYTMFDLVTFCLGMGLGLAYQRGRALFDSRSAAPVLGAVGLGLVAVSFTIDLDVAVDRAVIALQATGSALILAAGLCLERRIVRWRALEFVGDASYSIYLVHMYVIGVVIVAARRVAPDLPLSLLSAACFTAGTAGGLLAYLVVERPVMRMFRARERRAGRPSDRAGSLSAEPGSPAAPLPSPP